MPEQREFSLGENLESLVRATVDARSLSRVAQEDIDLDLRNRALRLYSSLGEHTNVDTDQLRVAAPWVVEQMLDAGETELYHNLNVLISDHVARGAREFYLSKLDEDHKVDFYADLLGRIRLPEAPGDGASAEEKESHTASVKAWRELGLANAVEKAARKGKLDFARGLVSNGLNVGTASLVSIYHGLGAKDTEVDLYRKVAGIRKLSAKGIIKDKKLYDLIDKALARSNVGKAYSLVGLYSAYQKQLEDSKHE